ncbi:nitrogen regulatory protein P-II [Desulfuromonas sp. DDH964]|uniref:P-II family nitrogen regulator n=1 Tax=Desulfuromonas sp. DDH964 TaxID=1823759 RepID=UPI00078B546B|nr:P-II family nitrogen regulator [Desulfuromonas sp. DDH964]AMV70614.1 nitrogen regulatory protein P-II [Desulfuromonas sp. DDH964]
MKEVKAYIKRHKLNEVILALRKVEGLTGVSILSMQGVGKGWHDRDADLDVFANRPPGVKLEICCRDDLVEAVVAAIERAAHTGLKGDGKIYVANLEKAVRISNGEQGEGAV